MTLGNTEILLESVNAEEAEEICECLKVLYSTRAGELGLDRDFGISMDAIDKPLSVAKAMIVAEIVRKTKKYEPRIEVARVEWDDAKAGEGILIPKVVLLSEIAQFDNLPDISFIDNLTMKEVEEMAKGGYIRSAREATGNTPTLYPASLPSIMVKEMALLHYQMLQYIDAGPKQTLLKYSTHENLDVLAGSSASRWPDRASRALAECRRVLV